MTTAMVCTLWFLAERLALAPRGRAEEREIRVVRASVCVRVQRPAVREGIMFISRTIVQRTQPGQRQSVKNDEYLCHVYVKAETGLAAIAIADSEYPTTAAFSVLHKVLDDFTAQHADSWQSVQADAQLANPILEPALVKYQVRLLACGCAKGVWCGGTYVPEVAGCGAHGLAGCA